MEPATYLGVDVGKTSHYAVAVDDAGKAIYQTGVLNDEAALSKLVDSAADHQASIVVDQPGGAAALLLKLCWQLEIPDRLLARAGNGACARFLCR